MDLGGLNDGVVLLRVWAVEDAEWYAATVTHDDLIQRFTSEPPTLTVEAVRSAIAQLRAAPPGSAGFLLADAHTGQPLGNIGLTYDNGVGEVSYWLAAAARGRGVATRALRLLSGWALTTLGLSQLRLWTHRDNRASGAVAERAGYARDPDRDGRRQIKGKPCDTVAYVLRRRG